MWEWPGRHRDEACLYDPTKTQQQFLSTPTRGRQHKHTEGPGADSEPPHPPSVRGESRKCLLWVMHHASTHSHWKLDKMMWSPCKGQYTDSLAAERCLFDLIWGLMVIESSLGGKHIGFWQYFFVGNYFHPSLTSMRGIMMDIRKIRRWAAYAVS